MDLTPLVRWLPRTALLSRTKTDDLVYKVCGEDLIWFFNRNPTGESIWAITQRDPSRNRVPTALTAMFDHRQPIVIFVRHITVDGYRREAWCLMMPFFKSAEGRAPVSDLLGVLIPIPDPPFCDGAVFETQTIDTEAALAAFCRAHGREGLDRVSLDQSTAN